MPVMTPNGVQFYINDLVNEVLLRCENRTTDTARAAIWIRDALLEIASNPDYRDDFQELEELGPLFNLTGGNSPSSAIQEYAESNLVPGGDVAVAAADIFVWMDPPNNTIRRRLDVSHYQKVDKFQPVYSVPTEWYRYGGTIGFNPIPDKNYQVQMRVVRMHPINDNILTMTLILLPRDWNEVIIWAAVQRGFMELMEYEKAASVHTMLYGDPGNKNKPGLIFHMKRKRERELYRQEQRLSMIRRPYGWGHA